AGRRVAGHEARGIGAAAQRRERQHRKDPAGSHGVPGSTARRGLPRVGSRRARRTTAMTVRVLGPSDVPTLQTFLAAHAASSLFLRWTPRAGGMVDGGEPYQATYVGAFEGERMVAVAAQSWAGFLTMQAPVLTAEVVRAALEAGGRPLRGFSGPW